MFHVVRGAQKSSVVLRDPPNAIKTTARGYHRHYLKVPPTSHPLVPAHFFRPRREVQGLRGNTYKTRAKLAAIEQMAGRESPKKGGAAKYAEQEARAAHLKQVAKSARANWSYFVRRLSASG